MLLGEDFEDDTTATMVASTRADMDALAGDCANLESEDKVNLEEENFPHESPDKPLFRGQGTLSIKKWQKLVFGWRYQARGI